MIDIFRAYQSSTYNDFADMLPEQITFHLDPLWSRNESAGQ
ncbi:hypothetical protein [Nitrosomonas sp.]